MIHATRRVNNMKKVMFILAVATMSVNSWAANPTAFGFELKPNSKAVKSKAHVSSCTSFDGNYEGRCNNSSDLKTLNISQMGCEQITIDGKQIKIGAIQTESTSLAGQSSSVTSAAQWDDKNDTLLLTQFSHYEMPGNGTVPFVIGGTMSNDGLGLVVDGNIWDEKIRCEYQKK